jgi:hypothetical protein
LKGKAMVWGGRIRRAIVVVDQQRIAAPVKSCKRIRSEKRRIMLNKKAESKLTKKID